MPHPFQGIPEEAYAIVSNLSSPWKFPLGSQAGSGYIQSGTNMCQARSKAYSKRDDQLVQSTQEHPQKQQYWKPVHHIITE